MQRSHHSRTVIGVLEANAASGEDVDPPSAAAHTTLLGGDLPGMQTGVGLLIENLENRRLLESVSTQLDLVPVILDRHHLDLDVLLSLELILAEEPSTRTLGALLATRADGHETLNPALVAVASGDHIVEVSPDSPSLDSDAILPLPQPPAQLAIQLRLILHAHRAFARRHAAVMEELHLNRRIFSSVTSGISVADASKPDMPLTYVNPAFEAMTGYSFREIEGKNCRFLQGEMHDQPGLTLIREAIRDQREVVTLLQNFRKDGTPFWNELSLSPIRNRDGELTHFVGIQSDVTTRIEFEAALRESEKLAAVGRLASSIAHEINNPLEAVMNLIYIAERTDTTENIRQYLAMADAELQRVKLIASQSLRFYKQSTKPQPVHSRDLVDSVLDLYTARLGNSKVTVHRRHRSARPFVCMESEIRQVLNNLVSNAIDAMHGHGGHLKVRTREATEWRSEVPGILITIADTGTGIDREILANIYKAFYTTKGIGGTGLGLWISSEIVERHHGRLQVRTSTRKDASGTVFQLFLPFQAFA